jgi:copper chaperone CopZ
MTLSIKNSIRIWSFIIMTLFSVPAWAQSDIQKHTFTVKGVCNDCKSRIEDAAYIKGVKEAKWDKQTQELSVIYRSSKTNPDAIKAAVLKTGHTVDSTEGNEKAYEALPACCQFKSGIHTH